MSKQKFELVTNFTIKEMNDNESSLIIEGYANTTTKDRQGDVILEEAWTKGGLTNYHKNPIMLAYHDHAQPIGTASSLSVDVGGLKIVAEISKAAGNVYQLIKDEVLKTFSVGFRVKDADYDSATDIFVIKDLELYEISVVSIPANADSTFSISKSFDDVDQLTTFKKEFTKEVPKASEPGSDQIVNTILESIDKKLKDSETNIFNKLKEKEEMAKDKVDVSTEVTGVEKLLKDFEDRMAEKDATVESSLEGLRAELAEKKVEIEALTKNKMTFEDRDSQVSKEDKDTAVLVAKLLGRGIQDTDFTKNLINKAGAHVTPMTADWEAEFSSRIENDIRQKLILEPLFRKVNMNAATMNIPVSPDAGTGLWVPVGDFKGTSSAGSTAQTHTLTDTVLTAHKLASREYIGYEEEEDAIIPLIPIIRDAIVRRVARSSDIALLRGTGTLAAQPNHDPISGLTNVAATAGGVQDVSLAVANKVTASTLATVRRGLGTWGLSPQEVVYVVSQDAYFDLLEDPDFRTMDMVGTNATILKGQIGTINGSQVIVSGEFEAKAANKYAAVCVNASNFIIGELRGVRMERDRLIVEQQNVIVTTRRMAFLDIITGQGVSALKWIA